MTLVHEFRDTYFAVSWFCPDYSGFQLRVEKVIRQLLWFWFY